MVNKVGSEKYYIIISLILGLMILTISLFWIFGEYFGEDEIDWQVCRQSILLRASLPEKDLVGLKLDMKGAFPLKCKTEVVTIDSIRTPEEVYEKIADAVTEGWYMFGEGKLDFIHRKFSEHQTLCMVFARIHFDKEAVSEFFKEDVSAWSDYFEERSGLRVSRSATDAVKQSLGRRDSPKGFIDYYRFAKIENSRGTYDDYLPLYIDKTSQRGNLVVNWDRVHFYPTGDKDYLLVYRINKASGVSEILPGRFLTSIVHFVGDKAEELKARFIGEKLAEDEVKSWENYRTIAITSIDSLDVLECDKFLTVPA